MAHHEAVSVAPARPPGLPRRGSPSGASAGLPARGPVSLGGVIPAGYKRVRLPDGHPDRYLVQHAITGRQVVAAGLPALEAWVAGVAEGTVAADSAVPGYGLDGFPLPAVEVEDPETQEVPAAAPPKAPAAAKPPAPAKPPAVAKPPAPPAAPAELATLTQRVEDLVKRQDQVLAELAELKATVGQLDAATTAAAQRLQTIHGNVADIQTTVHALAEAFLSAPDEAAPAGADGAGAGAG